MPRLIYNPLSSEFDFVAPHYVTEITIGPAGSGADYITDGTADQTEFNSAIDELYDLGGGRLRVLRGDYTVSGNIIVKKNVSIEGIGYASHIKLANSTALSEAGLIRVKDSSDRPANLRISMLRLNGNKANQSVSDKNYGLYTEADDVIFENCWVHDFPGYGLDPHEAEATTTPGSRIIIRNNYVYNNGTVASEDYDGITLDAMQYMICEGNITYGNARHGINIVTASEHSNFVNNISYDNGRNGVAVTSAGQYLNIMGNQIYSNGREGILLAEGSQHCNILGNFIHENGRQGIHLIGSKYNNVNSNKLFNNCQSANATYSEIYLDDDGVTYSTHNNVQDNTIIATNANKPTYGVEEKNVNNDFNSYGTNVISGMVTASTRYVAPNRFETMGGTQQNATADLGNVLSAIGARASGGSYTLNTSGFVQFTGSIRYSATNRTTNATLTAGTSTRNQFVDATSGNLTITLNATSTQGVPFTVKKTDASANTVTVNAGVGNTIDGAQTYVLTNQYDFVNIISTSTSGVWMITGK